MQERHLLHIINIWEEFSEQHQYQIQNSKYKNTILVFVAKSNSLKALTLFKISIFPQNKLCVLLRNLE